MAFSPRYPSQPIAPVSGNVCTVRSVAERVRIPAILLSELNLAHSFCKDPYEYISSKLAHVGYVQDILRPYAEIIFACIPTTVLFVDQLPLGRHEEIMSHVTEYMAQAVPLEYARINKVPPYLHPSVSWSLTLAETFDILLGRPHYGPESDAREVLLGRIRSASAFANDQRKPEDPIDVFIDVKYASLPRVPLWNRDRIMELLIQERTDIWAAEKATLQEEMDLSGNLDTAMYKSSLQLAEGFTPNPSGRWNA
ncbi:hypothetical protein C8R44DRAFT_896531 [Mycena epipterygia]|nr:hypothetical protein C8R44DRAFT_896531 [Mycena epipterygia]